MTDEYQVALAELERFVSRSPVAAKALEIVKAEQTLLENSGADVADDASKCIVDLFTCEEKLRDAEARCRASGPLVESLRAERGKLIEVVRAQHKAIDILFAKLAIWADRNNEKQFLPSKCGEPWSAAEAASKLMKELGEKL